MALEQRSFREMALFAGAGGGILGGLLLGWETICAVEINAFCTRRLMQRQNEGHLPPFPIWDDVSTFDGRPWCGLVDVVSGGFPCQGISAANRKATGLQDPRSGLWREQIRIIGEIQPRFAFVENSPMLVGRGLARVLGDFAEIGYHARWDVFSADAIGAEHERERLFILAYPYSPQCEGGKLSSGARKKHATPRYARWGKDKSAVDRMADGVANQLDRLRAIGNGQVPGVVKLAFQSLSR